MYLPAQANWFASTLRNLKLAFLRWHKSPCCRWKRWVVLDLNCFHARVLLIVVGRCSSPIVMVRNVY